MFAADVYKLIEGAADAAFVVTAEGEICFWNSASERLFGYKAADVLNKSCAEVLRGKDAFGAAICSGRCGAKGCALHTSSIPAFDLEVTARSGEQKWISVSTLVFDDMRLQRRLIVHLSHDISKRKETELAFARMLDISKEIISMGEFQSHPVPVESLSDQQQRILMLFSLAKSSSQVAGELGITLPTLRNHLHAINQKLRTHNRLEAVLHAMRRGLI